MFSIQSHPFDYLKGTYNHIGTMGKRRGKKKKEEKEFIWDITLNSTLHKQQASLKQGLSFALSIIQLCINSR